MACIPFWHSKSILLKAKLNWNVSVPSYRFDFAIRFVYACNHSTIALFCIPAKHICCIDETKIEKNVGILYINSCVLV